jgi:hypothetical protein
MTAGWRILEGRNQVRTEIRYTALLIAKRRAILATVLSGR